MSNVGPIRDPHEAAQRTETHAGMKPQPEASTDRWVLAYARAHEYAEHERRQRQQRTETETEQIKRAFKELARMAVLKYKHSKGLATLDEETKK